MTTGIDMLIVSFGLLALLLIWTYADWRERDRCRRLQRRAHLNVGRGQRR